MSMNAAAKIPWECDAPSAILEAVARKAMQTSHEMKDSGRVEVEVTMGFDGGKPSLRTFRIECVRSKKRNAKKRSAVRAVDRSEAVVSMSARSPLNTRERPEADIVTLGGLLNTTSECCKSSGAPKKEWQEPDIVTLGGLLDSDKEKSNKSCSEGHIEGTRDRHFRGSATR